VCHAENNYLLDRGMQRSQNFTGLSTYIVAPKACNVGCGRPGATDVVSSRRLEHRSAYGNLAGDENGLSASTTNITSACRSVEPLLETCIGISAPWPARD
jgi:hypothetical protein